MNRTRQAWHTRRSFLVLGSSAALWALTPRPGYTRQKEDEGEEESERVEELGRKAGLGPFRTARSEHFLAVGDAREAFLRSALKHCEALGKVLIKHLRDKGFRLEYPKMPLTVVALKGQESYGALLGEAPGKDVGGHYDLETNRLVMFDFRGGPKGPADGAERLNLFTLVHETAHQLSFNTGLFDRDRPPPLSLSEGIATYVELWVPGDRNPIGGLNRPRLRALRAADNWIPIADLLSDDRPFRGEDAQLAYAESWLLTHHFLRSSTRVPKFRDYLAELRQETRPAGARAVAEKRIGPLDRLDKLIKDEASRYLNA